MNERNAQKANAQGKPAIYSSVILEKYWNKR
jgi:hypothetical protein